MIAIPRIPSTTERVPRHTSEHSNRRINEATAKSILYSAAAGKEVIDRRIAELDREWDIERTLEANAAVVTLLSVTLGMTVSRKWFAFPAIIGGFLLQHAIQGWCPPVPVWRWLGVRTQSEIERERYALKALRGDFRNLPEGEIQAAVDETTKAIDR